MKKFILIITACLVALFTINVFAEERLGEAEIPGSLLRMSEDGTGIIKFSQCDGCKIILVKITPATRAYLNGVEMSVLQARERSKPGFIGFQFTLDSKEVRTIGFTN